MIASRFLTEQKGNVAMMFAFVAAFLLLGIGAAVDGSRMMSLSSDVKNITDGAALAGAISAEDDKADREAVVREYIKANAYKLLPNTLDGEPVIVFDDETEQVSVTIKTSVELMFGGVMSQGKKPVSSVSSATYMVNEMDPISIAFALDVSGSMGWEASNGDPKIDVLKSSTRILFDAIENGAEDPKLLKKYLRSGMSAYNTELVEDQPMSWGWASLESSVDKLVADGGTNSTPALQNSYDQLLADRNYRKNKDSEFDQMRLQEYVIFMTDGDNNKPEWDDTSAAVCETMRADGIEIYSVAFTAPEKGELLLLNCASSSPASETAQNAQNNQGQDGSKCNNNGSKGKGKAKGHCKSKKDLETDKGAYYFDAENAEAFETAFKKIGESIVESNIRLN